MRVPTSFLRKSALSPAAVALLALASACNQKDPQQCTQAQQVVRQSLDAQDFALARQWREYAYKQCDDTAPLAGLDKDIVDREAAVQAKKAADEKLAKETTELVRVFLDFVSQNRAAPERASAAPVCDPPPEGTPAGKETKDRFCNAVRQAGTHSLEVRYWDADHGAFRFSTKPDGPVDCKAVGGTVSKTWEVPAVGGKSAKRWRCDLTGPLAGLTAVVTGAAKAEMHVVSPSYLEHDPGWRPLLEGP